MSTDEKIEIWKFIVNMIQSMYIPVRRKTSRCHIDNKRIMESGYTKHMHGQEAKSSLWTKHIWVDGLFLTFSYLSSYHIERASFHNQKKRLLPPTKCFKPDPESTFNILVQKTKFVPATCEMTHIVLPVIQTAEAPRALALNMAQRPIGPAPVTRTFWPKVTPALRHPCKPTERGSTHAPSSKLTLSGSLPK